jgi:hypothetical protein
MYKISRKWYHKPYFGHGISEEKRERCFSGDWTYAQCEYQLPCKCIED